MSVPSFLCQSRRSAAVSPVDMPVGQGPANSHKVCPTGSIPVTGTSDVTRVYGPYLYRSGTNEGRRYVELQFAGGRRTTVLYSRWLWLTNHGPIPPGYDVDHIDNDKSNDSLGNLQLLTRRQNVDKRPRARRILVPCYVCNADVRLTTAELSRKQRRNRFGITCSVACTSKLGSMVRSGTIESTSEKEGRK